MPWSRRSLALLTVPVAMAGCAGAPAQAVMPNGGHDTSPLARCHVAASHDEPLVTEWPASYKARLEALLQRGAVAVAYSGCELRIVESCSLRGAYEWKRTTLSTDSTDIHDEDELYAKLPLGAAALSGQLQNSGSLHVITTVAGQMQLTGVKLAEAQADPGCAKATHVVTALSVGAFKLVAGGKTSASAQVGVGSAGGGASGSETRAILREAGDAARCASATATDPDPACRSPLQVFLEPLAPPATSAPATVTEGADAAPAPEPHGDHKLAGILTTGAGIVAAGVGVFLLAEAAHQKSLIAQGGFATGGDITSAASSAATDDNVGISLILGGAALGGIGVPMWVF
jgi:hypothetical protein